MRNWKWLFVDRCECHNPISTTTEILNLFQHGMMVLVSYYAGKLLHYTGIHVLYTTLQLRPNSHFVLMS